MLLEGQTLTHTVLKDRGKEIAIYSSQNPLFIANEIFCAHVYNPAELPIGENDIVVDIGANIGIFTLYAALRTQNRVYAFEPLPVNCENIEQNVKANHLENVCWFGTAVSDKPGTVKLYTSESVSGNLLFDHNIQGKITKYIDVSCTTLPTIMDEQRLERIDFLKVDCEGSEGDIFRSLPPEYLRRIRKIAMEFHDNVSAMSHEALKQCLESAGFVTKLSWNGRSPFGYLYAWQS